ncbi:MAG: hypothetical protein ABFD94_02800 [Armatimonadia bacterium]
MKGFLLGVKFMVLLAIFGAGCYSGVRWMKGDVEKLKKDIAVFNAKSAQALAEANARASQVSEHIVTQYLPAREKARAKTEEVINAVPEMVSPVADRACTLPVGFVLVYDASACGSPLPDPSGGPYDAPSGLELSAAAEAIAANNGTCNECRLQLLALQEWVRLQSGGAP